MCVFPSDVTGRDFLEVRVSFAILRDLMPSSTAEHSNDVYSSVISYPACKENETVTYTIRLVL